MVTGEVAPMSSPPPHPTLASLGPVNVNPPPVYEASTHGGHPPGSEGGGGATAHARSAEADSGSAFVGSLIEARGGTGAVGDAAKQQAHPHHSSGSHSGNHMEHIEEDHWPEASKLVHAPALQGHVSVDWLGRRRGVAFAIFERDCLLFVVLVSIGPDNLCPPPDSNAQSPPHSSVPHGLLTALHPRSPQSAAAHSAAPSSTPPLSVPPPPIN